MQSIEGTRLGQIAGSASRWPGFRVHVWDPIFTTISQLASGTETQLPLDITPYVERVDLSWNVGFEQGDDPSVPQAAFVFRRHPNTRLTMRRGLFADGVLVRVFSGDERVRPDEWPCIFTGTFRGTPGDDPGTPGQATEGLVGNAYGREERFLNLVVTTDQFPAETDLGTIAVTIATRYMGLTQDEILFGALGFVTKHEVSQIVEEPALAALWHCMFPVGKKPSFDGLGRLTTVDINLDKPAAKILVGDGFLAESLVAAPNEVEVNNSVVVHGLSAELSEIVQEPQLLVELNATTGYFDREFTEDVYYSQDHTQRAKNTFVVERRAIKWSGAAWNQVDEFHGNISVDTRHLSRIRTILFATFLATSLLIALIDFAIQEGGIFVTILTLGTLAAVRLALQILSLITLVGFLWATTFVGRGVYEVHGSPFEFVHRELTYRGQLDGLELPEVRELELRNDFITTMDGLAEVGRERLKRELVKDQVFAIGLADDPSFGVDDVLEDHEGNRYYTVSVRRTLARDKASTMELSCWKTLGAAEAVIDALAAAEA